MPSPVEPARVRGGIRVRASGLESSSSFEFVGVCLSVCACSREREAVRAASGSAARTLKRVYGLGTVEA